MKAAIQIASFSDWTATHQLIDHIEDAVKVVLDRHSEAIFPLFFY
jgi:hypothetical protein